MKILIAGKNGMLGSALMRVAIAQGLDVVGLARRDMDITNGDAVRNAYEAYPDIDIVINAAGTIRNAFFVQTPLMAKVNTLGPHILSAIFPKVVQISTDCVFSGDTGEYYEDATPSPVDLYGITKLGGELHRRPNLTIRGSFIGFGEGGFLDRMILSQPHGATIHGFGDWWWNGFYVDTFAALVLQFARIDMSGLIHAVGPDINKFDLLQRIATKIRPDIDVEAVKGNPDDKRLRSVVFPYQGEIIGVDYPITWEVMIERMASDYSNFGNDSSRPK